MLQDKLGIDDRDVKLLSIIMHDAEVSQQDLAKQLSLSQPSVNVRLRKLKEKGVLVHATGIDAKRANVSLARVDFTCPDAERLLQTLSQCSFFVNGFITSGTRNVSVFLIGEDLRKVEHIVNKYLRVNKRVDNIELSVIVNTAKPFVCSVDVEKEQSEPCANPENCNDCKIRKELHLL